jgi:hypothetical protein
MLFTSEYYSVDYRYDEFKEKNKCSPYKEPDVAKRGQKYNNAKSAVDEFIEKMITDKKCSFYKSLLQEFLSRKNSTESLYDKKYDLRQELANAEAFNQEIQAHFAFRGWSSALCSISHVTERNKEYWWLLTKVLETMARGSIVQVVSENGQEISHCGNVKAFGTKNLKEFTVSLEAAKSNKIKFTNNAYGVSDQFKVFSSRGSLLYDSGCKGAVGEQKEEIKISKITSPFVKIEVIANCSEGDQNTAWELSISCDADDEVSIDQCTPQIKELIELLKKFLDVVPPILDNYWMQAMCYEKTHKHVLKNMKRVDLFMEVLSVGKVNLEGYNRVDLGEKQNFKGVEEIPFTQNVEKPETDQDKDTDFDYQFIIKNRKELCGDRPDAGISIFKIISWNYCFHGVKKLFSTE